MEFTILAIFKGCAKSEADVDWLGEALAGSIDMIAQRVNAGNISVHFHEADVMAVENLNVMQSDDFDAMHVFGRSDTIH